jgi:hypothetical protein
MSETTDSTPKSEKAGDKVSAQIFHDRARGAAEEIHKLLLSFSGATLGIYFIALTKEISQLTILQKFSCLAGVMIMGTAVFVGLLGLFADMKRYYFWACAIQEHDHRQRDEFYRERDRWLARQRLSRPVLFVCFSIGIIFSIVFVMFRIADI